MIGKKMGKAKKTIELEQTRREGVWAFKKAGANKAARDLLAKREKSEHNRFKYADALAHVGSDKSLIGLGSRTKRCTTPDV